MTRRRSLRSLLFSLYLLFSFTASLVHAAPGQDKYGFVTIHYEGTPGDAEYVLGVRVLLKSLQPLRHPFLILVSDNVSSRTREIFQREGATLIDVRVRTVCVCVRIRERNEREMRLKNRGVGVCCPRRHWCGK